MDRDHDIVVIGAGIIGIAIAAYLAEAGRNVTVIDRDGVCEGTSSGNAAAFAFSDILPLAQKGMLRHLPRWILDPLGPLTIPPSYLPRIAPWLIRFWKAGRPRNRTASIRAQSALMRLSETEWLSLMDRSQTRRFLREDGSLELYESDTELERLQADWDKRTSAGIEYRHVRGSELDDLQPGLSAQFVAGTFVPGWKTVSDPKKLALALWKYCESLGARIRLADVNSLSHENNLVRIHFEDGTSSTCRTLIIAAGAWSHLLTKFTGDNIPLETERGYNTTLPSGAFELRRQLIFGSHGFVITPIEDGIRIGGAVEFAGLKRPPNYNRAKAMLVKAKKFLPGLQTSGGREWMGYRPSLPDSLPVIGRSRISDNILYAFGHGHLGLTQAAATGRLICDLVLRQSAAIEIQSYSPGRFRIGPPHILLR